MGMARLTPRGPRVLVAPDEPPTETESGLVQLPADRDFVPTSGTVVAVGTGSLMLREAKRAAVRHCLTLVTDPSARTPLWRFHGQLTASHTPDLLVGDRVVFGPHVGMVIQDGAQRYVLLDEDDVAVVVSEQERRDV